MPKIIISATFFIDSQGQEVHEGRIKRYCSLSSGCFSVIVLCWAHTCLFFSSLFADNRSQDESTRSARTVEVLEDLSLEIIPYWKSLGHKLKVPNEKIDAIQLENVQYPRVEEKAFQMLMVWRDLRSDVAKVRESSKALKALGKGRTEMKYCRGSNFMDDTAI